MAESFSNSLTRRAGIITTSTSGSVGVSTNIITGISTFNVSINSLVDNTHFIGGTRVTAVGTGQVTVNTTSTNTTAATTQAVNFLGITTAFTATAKSIIIGGTLANNTGSQVAATVQISSGSTSYNLLYEVPVPAGSSLVISDAGKTLLLPGDRVDVAANANGGVDLSLSILVGVD